MNMDVLFFQAEDGIRDIGVTGVQTCALPICLVRRRAGERALGVAEQLRLKKGFGQRAAVDGDEGAVGARAVVVYGAGDEFLRSEERRVGKECRSRWLQDHYKKKEIDIYRYCV